MSKQQDWLVRAAVELGLRVETDYPVVLKSGQRVVPEAFFPDLGSRDGILIFNSSMTTEVMKEIRQLGYASSFFAEPHDSEEYDVDGYAEMFSEWGWAGRAVDRPEWMDGFEM